MVCSVSPTTMKKPVCLLRAAYNQRLGTLLWILRHLVSARRRQQGMSEVASESTQISLRVRARFKGCGYAFNLVRRGNSPHKGYQSLGLSPQNWCALSGSNPSHFLGQRLHSLGLELCEAFWGSTHFSRRCAVETSDLQNLKAELTADLYNPTIFSPLRSRNGFFG